MPREEVRVVLSIRKCAARIVNSENICNFIFTNCLGYYEIQECSITRKRKKHNLLPWSVPVISEQKLRHFTCDSRKIKYGKPEFRKELRKMIQSKTSVATNEGIYKLENTQLLIAKTRRTPALRISLIATVMLDLIIQLPRILPASSVESVYWRLICPHVTPALPGCTFFLCLAYSVRWVFLLIHPWRGVGRWSVVGSMRTLIHGSMCSKHRSSINGWKYVHV